MVERPRDAAAALRALRAGHGPLLEALAAEAAGTGTRPWLVGGAVRDALLGRRARELDVTVEWAAPGGEGWPSLRLAEALAQRLNGSRRVHERFGTATVESPAGRVDLAGARVEHYARPGALPEPEPADLDADLRRRDVSVNAIALGLDGELRAADRALDDLRAGRLRVLHERSFVDDPTRALRLGRYAARLGFEVEPRTAELAREATMTTVSADRVAAELRLALGEEEPLAVLAAWRDLGVLPDELEVRPQLTARALRLLPPDGRADLLVLAANLRPGGDPARLGLPASERDVVRRAAEAPPLEAGQGPLDRWPVEAVALAGARGEAEAARRWLERDRHVRLTIDGDDLVRAGIPPGPEIGRRLAVALQAKRAGRAVTPEEELAAALEAPGQ